MICVFVCDVLVLTEGDLANGTHFGLSFRVVVERSSIAKCHLSEVPIPLLLPCPFTYYVYDNTAVTWRTM